VLVVAGLRGGGAADWRVAGPIQGPGIGVAMVLVLYAYGGWNDAAFVAAEVRNRNRNMPLALILGTAGIALIYLLVNVAYLWALGFEGTRASKAPAAEVLGLAVGDWGARGMSLLVMLSALGAANGLLLTGSRICVGLGRDHRIFARLGRWNVRRGTPLWSIVAFGLISLLLVVVVGTANVQHAMDWALQRLGLPPVNWAQYGSGFDALVSGTAPVFWMFFLLTGISLIVLRVKDRGVQRPFSAPFFPLEPIVFCGTCIYMLYSAMTWAQSLSLLGLVPLAIGIPLYLLSQWASRGGSAQESMNA
jgi:APA family basic amino acid/polyamine antiporter